jgi:hypothetical protein
MIFADSYKRTRRMLESKGYPIVLVDLGESSQGIKIDGKCPMLGDDNRCEMFELGLDDQRPADCFLVEVSPFGDCARHRAKMCLPPLEEI